MRDQRRPILAVIGSGASALEPAIEALAFELGRLAVTAGWRIVTGGLGGVMSAVSRGGRSAATWQDGDILGILPGYDRSAANQWVDVVLPTGLQIGRNILVVAAADVVVALAGGAGTLSEIAIAWQLGKPIIALRPGDGWASSLSGMHLDGRHERPIQGVDTVEEALAAAQSYLRQHGPEPGEIGSGWRRRVP